MKNLLLSAVAMIAVTSLATAQLSVSPNTTTSTDSYIYVDGVQIYVEDYVRMQENTNDPDTEASIYLRNDAQLLQGVGTLTNRGSGSLSVYQEGNSDAYDYNLWSSPVSEPTSTGNQSFGIDRLNEETGLTSSASAALKSGYDGEASPLRISSRWFYKWDVFGQVFRKINSGNTVVAGRGFIMKGTGVTASGVPETQSQRYDFRGRPNNGDISLTIRPLTDDTPGNFEGGNTLAGNPYPSAMDLNKFFYDPANAGKINMIQFYDEDRTINSHAHVDNKAGYGTWTPGAEDTTSPGDAGYDPGDALYNPGNYTVPTFQNFNSAGEPISNVTTGNINGPYVERRMSPIGQGFFIQVSPAVTAPGTLTYKNAHRRFIKEGGAAGSEFRNAQGTIGGQNQIDPTQPTTDSSPGSHLRINTYMGVSHMRQTLLIIDDNTTDAFDFGYDGMSPMDATSEMYFAVKTPWHDRDLYPFVINAIPFDDVLKMIPITFEIEEEMTVTVAGIEELNLPFNNAYVFDSFDRTYQEITGQNAASYLLQEGTHADRFFIVFRKEFAIDQTSTREQEAITVAGNVSFFQNNRQAQLEVSNPEGYDIKSAAIFDMNGRLVLNQQNLGNNRNLQFPTGTFSDGVYLVVLTTKEDAVIDYKILVENK